MKTIISSEDFDLAYKNTDNIKIIKSVCKKYSKFLDIDTLRRCGMIGLLHCMQNHDSKRQKFTTSLYRFVKWECQRETKELYKYPESQPICDVIDIKTKSLDCYALDSLSDEHKTLLYHRFWNGYTLRELEKMYNKNKETIRKNINSAIEILRNGVK
jgi:hypothetical protein